MKVYNLYYKYEKINKYPLLKNDICEIIKYNKITFNNKTLNLSDINIVECTLI